MQNAAPFFCAAFYGISPLLPAGNRRFASILSEFDHRMKIGRRYILRQDSILE
jgi:hypothetical protein